MTRRSRRGIAGEGRPPRPGGALVPVTVRLPPETVARMDAARGDDTRSEWVREAVEARLAGAIRNPPREAPPPTREGSGDKGPGGD